MQDHEFEKQVHQKMDELNLRPSDTVWEKVERQLHRNEKRRRWVLWLPMFILAGIGGYFLWNSVSEFQRTTPANGSTETAKQPTSAKNPGQPSTPAFRRQAESIGVPESSTDTRSLKVETATVAQAPEQVTGKKTTGRSQHALKSTPVLPLPSSLSDQPTHISSAAAVERVPAGTNKQGDDYKLQGETVAQENSQASSDPATKNSADSEVTIRSANVMFLPPPPEEIHIFPRFNTNDPGNSVRLQTVKKGWEWGITFRAGRSSINNGQLNQLFASARVADMSSSLSQGPNTPINNAYSPPAPLKPGFGFSSGVMINRQIKPRIAFSAGLNYTLYSTSQEIGRRLDSVIVVTGPTLADQKSIETYSRSGGNDPQTSNYHNKYHFLELPVSVQFALFKNNKIPVSWDIGFSVSRLIGTNALHFDNTSRVFYKDNTLFNKTQFNVVTGLPIRFFDKKSYAIEAGPSLEYGVTKLLQTGSSGNKHLLFVGLKMDVLLKRNK